MNFKGRDCVSHVPQHLAGMDECVDNSASEELNTFVAPSSSSTQSVVSGKHVLYGRI